MTSGETAIVRAMHSRCCWPPDRAGRQFAQARRDLVPQTGAAQAVLDDDVELAPVPGKAVNARPVGHVVVDGLRERVGFLEYHADPRAQLHDVDRAVVDVGAVQRDMALDPHVVDGVVHAVEALDIGRLAASRRADQRRDPAFGDVQVDAGQRLLVAVPELEVARAHLHRAVGRRELLDRNRRRVGVPEAVDRFACRRFACRYHRISNLCRR